MRTAINNSKRLLHFEAFKRKTQELDDSRGVENQEVLLIQQIIYYGVKSFIQSQSTEPNTEEEAKAYFQVTSFILKLIGVLTPRQLEEVFPIDKTYDGERWEIKDYFYTRSVLDKFPADGMISDTMDPFELLTDYENIWLRVFAVQYMHYADCIRKFQGQESIMKAWCDENDIPTHTMHTDPNGKKFAMENGTGKVTPLVEKKPRRPKWIHVVRPNQRIH